MRINSLVIVLSCVILAVSFWNRNAIPGRIAIDDALLREPGQTASDRAPFDVRFNSIDYRVVPQFRYVLHGLVVSYRQHDGNSRMHRLAGDHLNMLDACVVWGSNVNAALLRQLSFWNGIFTCNVETGSREAWDEFDMTALANNHLISDDPLIRDRVGKLRVGDQVRIEGWLASYGASGGPVRATSISREDTGDGACETIYVSGFEVIEKGRSAWRMSMWLALASLGASLVVHFRRPFRPFADE